MIAKFLFFDGIFLDRNELMSIISSEEVDMVEMKAG
jgi:hypothetical protein